MTKLSFSFRKEERLKSRKTIDKLFKSGQSFGQFPLRVVWMELENPMGESPVQFALTVPKKNPETHSGGLSTPKTLFL